MIKKPCDVRDTKDFLGMETDNFSFGEYSIAHDGSDIILFTGCGKGRAHLRQVVIPVTTFNKLIEWYQKEQNFIGAVK